MIPGIEALSCGELAVPADVMAHVIDVESSRNPFAIGVVGGRLVRQPANLQEAVATVEMLESRGFNYSVGLAQVNRVNFRRFGIDAAEQAFDVCINLRTGASILAECLQQHDGRWGDAFSCYYSGNAETGYQHGYVQKVFASMARHLGAQESPVGPIALHSGDAATRPSGNAASANRLAPFVAARVTAAGASRRLPLHESGSSAVGNPPLVSESVPNLSSPSALGATRAPEELFMQIARARVAEDRQTLARKTGTAAPLPMPLVPAEAVDSRSPRPAEVQEHSNPEVDPARVY